MLERLAGWFALLWLIGASGSSRARWTGSRLNTTAYNMEAVLIEQAREDYAQAQLRPTHASRKELLCATFLFGAPKTASVFLANLRNPAVQCDWAVIVYDGDASLVCDQESGASTVIHCRLAPPTLFVGLSLFNSSSSSSAAASSLNASFPRPTIPKTLLYTELSPYLRNYQRVLLLDEDISLQGFRTRRFVDLWGCAFGTHAPLVVQAVVAENTQFLGYMNARAWRGSGVVASASGLVEQQCPAFDSIFFEWLLARVLPLPRDVVRSNGVDWGHDRTWCNAAQMYAQHVLHYPSSSPGPDASRPYLGACAVLPGADPVHHLNFRSMRSKRTQRQRYRKGGRLVVQRYIDLFPTW